MTCLPLLQYCIFIFFKKEEEEKSERLRQMNRQTVRDGDILQVIKVHTVKRERVCVFPLFHSFFLSLAPFLHLVLLLG